MTEPKNSPTVKDAADAKGREGSTGSSHPGLDKVMKDMDKADKPAANKPAKEGPTPDPKKP